MKTSYKRREINVVTKGREIILCKKDAETTTKANSCYTLVEILNNGKFGESFTAIETFGQNGSIKIIDESENEIEGIKCFGSMLLVLGYKKAINKDTSTISLTDFDAVKEQIAGIVNAEESQMD